MASPRVFVSSTFYDLKYIRENLKYFIRTLGYEPTLSEDGDIFYHPRKHTHDSCISEVPSCQMFVLIIGGRYGGIFREGDKSITNTEYLEAIKQKLPVFALVEASVYAEHHVYNENVRKHGKEQADKVAYPSVNDVRIFEFIDDVRKNVINNAIVPFRDFADIESYLRKQWAGMMFSFLTGISEEARVYDTLSELTKMSEKIELLSKQILSSVGSAKAKLTIRLFEAMMKYESFRDLTYFGIRPTPSDVVKAKNFIELGKKYGVEIGNFEDEEDNSGFVKSTSGKMSTAALEMSIDNFKSMREELESIILESGLTVEEFVQE